MKKKAKPNPAAAPADSGRRECPACRQHVYVNSATGRFGMHFQVQGMAVCRQAGEPST